MVLPEVYGPSAYCLDWRGTNLQSRRVTVVRPVQSRVHDARLSHLHGFGVLPAVVVDNERKDFWELDARLVADQIRDLG